MAQAAPALALFTELKMLRERDAVQAELDRTAIRNFGCSRAISKRGRRETRG